MPPVGERRKKYISHLRRIFGSMKSRVLSLQSNLCFPCSEYNKLSLYVSAVRDLQHKIIIHSRILKFLREVLLVQHFMSGMFQPSPYIHCLMASARARNLAKECQISRRFNEENHCDLFVEIDRDGILTDFRENSILKESSMSVWNSEKKKRVFGTKV